MKDSTRVESNMEQESTGGPMGKFTRGFGKMERSRLVMKGRIGRLLRLWFDDFTNGKDSF